MESRKALERTMSTSVLPVGDVYCKTFDEAVREMGRRKRDAHAHGMIVSFEESPYGGYRVYSVPADTVVDDLVDPILPSTRHRHGRKRVYR